MSNLKLWFRAVRPFAYPASIIPVILGTSLAYLDGSFSLFLFMLTLIGGILLHTGTNLANDYFDYINGIDTIDSHGSSGVLVNSLLKPKQIFRGAIIALSLVIPIGIYLTILRGPWLMIIGIVGLLGGYFYTAEPVGYKYHGLGAPIVFLLMGPLMVIGPYFVQTGSFDILVLLASLPVGCLVSAILYANEYRDIKHDRSFGIISPSILLGRNKAKYIYYLLVGGAYFVVAYMVMSSLLSGWALLTLITIPVALKPVRAIEAAAKEEESPELPIIDVLTAQLHLQFGLLFVLGITLGGIL